MTTALNPTDHPDVYVAGLCLALIVASAVPPIAGGTLWLSLLLLAVVWSQVLAHKSAPAIGTNTLVGSPASLNPTIGGAT